MAEVAKRDSMEATVPDLAAKLKETHIRSAPPKYKPSLTTLPSSIRNKIYAHVLDTELVNVGAENVSYTHSIKDGMLQFKASRPPFPVHTSLFFVNKQLSKEALRYFYSKNLFVRFELYSSDARHAKTMLEDSGVLFSTATPAHVAESKQHAMDLTLVEKNSSQKRTVVMFPAQYLPRLINFLDQASKASGTWAPTHSLFITLLNTYDFSISRLQGDLLELFRLLTNIGGVTIEGKDLLPGYADGLHSSMTAPSFTAESFLAIVEGIADRAEEAYESGEWDKASQHAQSATIALTYGYLTRPEPLHMKPDTFHKSIQRLRWRVELTAGKALLNLHRKETTEKDWLTSSNLSAQQRATIAKDLLATETAVSQALSLATDSPSPASNPWFQSLPPELIPPNKGEWFTDNDRAETWYACGLVHTALGEYLFAAGDLERACGLDAEGKGYADAFEKAREGIDWSVKPGSGMKKATRIVKAADL
jgi:hypothetical protein